MKSSRYLTHMHEIADAVARFWESLRRRRRLGPIHWQLPENFQRDDDLLASALDILPPAHHCFEFRHPSWFVPAIRQLLDERHASLAIGLRLHYGARGRDGNYSSAELDHWRRRIAGWRRRRDVFVYLNNDWRGFAPAHARELKQGLGRIGPG